MLFFSQAFIQSPLKRHTSSMEYEEPTRPFQSKQIEPGMAQGGNVSSSAQRESLEIIVTFNQTNQLSGCMSIGLERMVLICSRWANTGSQAARRQVISIDLDIVQHQCDQMRFLNRTFIQTPRVASSSSTLIRFSPGPLPIHQFFGFNSHDRHFIHESSDSIVAMSTHDKHS
jgi:hypothetical protein